jgi:hypothetical protein
MCSARLSDVPLRLLGNFAAHYAMTNMAFS